MSIFSKVKLTRPGRNKFDLSHERKMSLNMGNLVPFMVQDIVPGDSFRVSTEIMLRFAPLLAPIMHRVNVFTHYFFVPNRLVWTEWEDFITGGPEGTTAPVAPYMTTTQMQAGGWMDVQTLADYMGLPIIDSAPADPVNISALPFRAYQLIYNEYYRDQNLQTAVDFSKASGQVAAGAATSAICAMQIRCWEKDYFTSALPWSQRGGDVLIPTEGIATNANGDIDWTVAVGSPVPPALSDLQINPAGAGGGQIHSTSNEGSITIENIDEIRVQNVSTTVNDLRRAVRLQEWLEKNARGGARYVEQILSHFGVRSSDARLQRPEYLGGGRTPVVISEVLSTFEDATGNPQGTMAGHGISIGNVNGFKRTFEEHGYVIGIMSVIPKTAYQQGIPRHFSRSDKFDYYWPEFANIGEQEIKNKEVYYSTADINPENTFGYQSRYCEYKYGMSSVHGEFKTNLAFWHMGRIFESVPQLNGSFVESDPTYRIFAVEGAASTLYCQLYNRIDALRPMPYFGTPTF